MYPTISHLLNDLFGIDIPLPIQTFGFWVAIAFVAASYVVVKELNRKENEGHLNPTTSKVIIGKGLTVTEIASSLITGFFIGFTTHLMLTQWAKRRQLDLIRVSPKWKS
jgi:hypothetical protein